MTTEVQLELIHSIVPIITALISLVGAIAAALSYWQSGKNKLAIRATNANVDVNNAKTDAVGHAVNGRMTAFIIEMQAANEKALESAVQAAVALAEKNALAHITALKAEIAKAKSEKEVASALNTMPPVVDVHVINNANDPVPVKTKVD